MKRSKLLGIVCVVVMVAGLLVAGCAGEAPPTEGPPTEGPPEVKTLKVGATGPLSGLMAAWGINQLRGQRIWAECINDGSLSQFSDKVDPEGGIWIGGERYMIDYIEYDDKGEPAETLNVTKKLILDDECKILFPSIEFAGPALGDLCQSEGAVMIQIAGLANVIGPDRSLVFIGSEENSFLLSETWYALETHPDAQRIALINPDISNGRMGIAYAWKVAVRDFGREVVYDGLYPIDMVDAHPFMTAVLATEPDMIVASCAWPNDTALCIEAAYDLGYEGYWCTNTYVLSLILPKVPAEHIEGYSGGWTYGGWTDSPLVTEEARWYIEQWNARYGWEEWTTSSPGNYAAARVMQAGIEAADSVDPYDIAAALEAMDPVPHPLGPSKWWGEHFWGIDHTLLVPLYTYEIRNGEMVTTDCYYAPYPWDYDVTGLGIPEIYTDAVLEIQGKLK